MTEHSGSDLNIVRVKGREYLVPRSISDNPRARRLFVRAVERSLETYERLLQAGVPEEEAKYVLITPFAEYLPESELGAEG